MSCPLEDILADFRERVASRIKEIGEFEDSKVLKHEAQSQWVAILRDCNNNDNWRIQRFDENGFIGHEIFRNKEEALNTAVRERYSACDDGALDRLAKTNAFRMGNEISSERDKLNASVITFKDFLLRSSQITKEYQAIL